MHTLGMLSLDGCYFSIFFLSLAMFLCFCFRHGAPRTSNLHKFLSADVAAVCRLPFSALSFFSGDDLIHLLFYHLFMFCLFVNTL